MSAVHYFCHVKDMKILHVDSDVVLEFLLTSTHNMEIFQILPSQGVINYSSLGKVNFSMVEYIGNMLDNIPKYTTGG